MAWIEELIREAEKSVDEVEVYYVEGTSVSAEAVEYCRQQGISVIAGACPMMYGPNVDFGHTCARWILRLTGRLPQ